MARISKSVIFLGSSLDDLRAFPTRARRMAGFQIDRVQNGEAPHDWKPMNAVGVGVREIRVRSANGTFRVIYVAKLGDAIYVLHCFQKKSQRTSKEDVSVATRRCKQLVEELK